MNRSLSLFFSGQWLRIRLQAKITGWRENILFKISEKKFQVQFRVEFCPMKVFCNDAPIAEGWPFMLIHEYIKRI